MQMNLVCSMKHCHPKFLHLRGKHCSGGKHSKVQLTGMAASNTLGEKIPMFGLENLPFQDASSTFVTSLADIDLKRKHGWMGHFLMNGCMSLIVSSKCKEERLSCMSLIVSSKCKEERLL